MLITHGNRVLQGVSSKPLLVRLQQNFNEAPVNLTGSHGSFQ